MSNHEDRVSQDLLGRHILIPYAFWDNTLTHRICPECGQAITDPDSDTGRIDRAYADHFLKSHSDLKDKDGHDE